MSKIKLSVLISLAEVCAALGSMKLPAKVAYRLAKNQKKFQQEIQTYDEQRIALAKEFGTLSEDGRQYVFEEVDKKQAFTSGLNELMQEEVEIELATFTIEELGEIMIEPQILAALDGHILV